MRFTFPLSATHVLLTLIFCFQSNAQSAYPTILLDSNTLDDKISYLQNIGQSKDNYSGPNIIIILVDDLGKNDITLYDRSWGGMQRTSSNILFLSILSIHAPCIDRSLVFATRR